MNIRGWPGAGKPYLLDGVTYPIIDVLDIPPGSSEVDITIIDTSNKRWPSVLIAGNMGTKVTLGSGESGDTVQNVPMWCCCSRK